ncbi:MAG: FeoA family protein [Bacillales bacterium]
MPLIIAPLDIELVVVKVLLSGKVKKHLENLGITINSKFKLLSKDSNGVIILIKDGRLALDKETATKILVKC